MKLFHRNRSIRVSSFLLEFTLQRFASLKLNCVWHTINKLWIRLIYYWVCIFYLNGYIVNCLGLLWNGINWSRFICKFIWRHRRIFYLMWVDFIMYENRVSDVMFICLTFREYFHCLYITKRLCVSVSVKASYVKHKNKDTMIRHVLRAAFLTKLSTVSIYNTS